MKTDKWLLEGITTKITKDDLRLPYAIRLRMTPWELKPVHHHCAYDPTLQRWQVNQL